MGPDATVKSRYFSPALPAYGQIYDYEGEIQEDVNVVPHNKQDWLRFLVFPFKAYVIIAPASLLISAQYPHAPHSGPAEAQIFLVVSLFPCSLILLLAALAFALTGPKGFALPCLGFGIAAFIIGFTLLPSLAVA